MSCNGQRKSGKSCKCRAFIKREKDGMCTCKHPVEDHVPATRPSVLNILKLFEEGSASSSKDSNSARSQSQAEAARAETISGFRPKKDSKMSKTKAKSSVSKEVQESVKSSKIGSIMLITCGITEDNELEKTKAPSKAMVEKLYRYGLVVRVNADGSPLEFKLEWSHRDVDRWLRQLFPKPFQWLDRFGELEPGVYHWQLAGKEYRSFFLIERPNISGGELYHMRGPSSRSYREWELRVATRRPIPEEVYSDWDRALSRPLSDFDATPGAGGDTDSEGGMEGSETAETPAMGGENTRRSLRSAGKRPQYVQDGDDSDTPDTPTVSTLPNKGKGRAAAEESDDSFQDSDGYDILSDEDDLPSLALLFGDSTSEAGPSSTNKRRLASEELEKKKRRKGPEHHWTSQYSWEPTTIDLSTSPAKPPVPLVEQSESSSGSTNPTGAVLPEEPTLAIPASPQYSAPKRVFSKVPRVSLNPWQ